MAKSKEQSIKETLRRMGADRELYSTESEQVILSILLHEQMGGEKSPERLEILSNVSVDDFYWDGHRQLFTLLKQRYNEGKGINEESVAVECQDVIRNMRFPSGDGFLGFAGISRKHLSAELKANGNFSTAHIENMKKMRRFREIAGVLAVSEDMLLRDGMAQPNDITDYLMTFISSSSEQSARKEYSPEEFADRGMEFILRRASATADNSDRMNTSFRKLQATVGGFSVGQLVIVSASTGAGKSAYALNLAKDFGVMQKIPTLYLNSEMTAQEVMARMYAICSDGRLKFDALFNGQYQGESTGELAESKRVDAVDVQGVLRRSKFSMVDLPYMDAQSVLKELRIAKEKWGTRVAFVDYIGRMGATSAENSEIWRLLLNGVGALKEAAKSLGMLVFMVAQLDSSGTRLAQSSYMSHEADLWINIRDVNQEEFQKEFPCNKVLEFKKGRSCKIGKPVYMMFRGEYMTFTDDDNDIRESKERIEKSRKGNDFGGVPVKNVPV